MAITRRDFLRGTAGTLTSLGVAGLPACSLIDAPAGVDAYELVVDYAEHTIGGYRLRTRTYNKTIPGPVIRTAPGHTLRLDVANRLPPNPPWPSGAPRNRNDPHDFNTTNIHVHGLDVIPHLFEPLGTTKPDAMMIAIEPGTSYRYDFRMPDDHPSGLYWYHPHHHGSTATQVMNGMAGLLIIEGMIDRVPEIAAARQEFIAVQSLRLAPDASGVYVNEPLPGRTPADGGFKTKEFALTLYTVNGEAVGWKGPAHNANTTQLPPRTIEMRPGEVIRFRILNGTDEQLMPIQLDGHVMHVIGYDGVNLPQPQEAQVVTLAPANRVEVLVKAGAPGGYAFRQNPVTGEQFENNSGMILANINVANAPKDMALPASLPIPTRNYPLIKPAEISRRQTLTYGSVFPDSSMLTGIGFNINGTPYDEMRLDYTARVETMEEWTIVNPEMEGHPMHIHVNSFEVVQVGDTVLPAPMVVDTVWVPKHSQVKLRIRFRQWTGKSVYHCHILIHEDLGMMQNFVIAPAAS